MSRSRAASWPASLLAAIATTIAATISPCIAHAAAALAPVEVARAERAPIVEEVRLTGTLTSPRTARLASEVAGRIARLHVDAGDRVEAGEVLLELDEQLARLELEQARAAEREAGADLADAERRLAEARALASSQSFAETEVRSRAAAVERARAELARLRAASAYRAALVERHRLRAPFAGVVARREAELGEWVAPESPVLHLVAVDRLRLELQVPQGYFARIAPGTPLEVRLDAPAGEPLRTRVSELVPVSDPATRTFLVRARIDNAAGTMTPGMSARAVIALGTGREGVVVPRDALIRHPDGRTVVWAAHGQGATRVVRARRVETGLAFGQRVEITTGLEAGTPVVVRGNESLREGQEVRVGALR